MDSIPNLSASPPLFTNIPEGFVFLVYLFAGIPEPIWQPTYPFHIPGSHSEEHRGLLHCTKLGGAAHIGVYVNGVLRTTLK